MAVPTVAKPLKPDPLGEASVELAKSLINAISCTQAANTNNVQARNDLPNVLQALALSLTKYGEALRNPSQIVVGRMVQG